MEDLTTPAVTKPATPPAPRRATERQRAAARRNGAKSRGPVTAEGKTRVSQNAVKHGLATQSLLTPDILLPGESPDRFLKLNADILGRLAPADELELAFVETFVMARWRQRRSWDLEASNFNSEIVSQIASGQADTPPIAACKAWNALAERSDGFRLLHRYESRHRRDMSRAIRDLDYARNLKLPNKPGNA